MSLSLGDIYLDIFLCFLDGIYIVDNKLHCNQVFIHQSQYFFNTRNSLSLSLSLSVFSGSPLCSFMVSELESTTMASTNATSSSSTSNSTIASTALPANTLLLLLFNMSSMMTVKIDYGNYIVWKHQIEVILETYSMIDVIDDSVIALDHFLKDSSGNFTTEINPSFISWKNCEQAMFTFINSTLSPSILALTVGQKVAKGVWKVLEKRFASISRSHVMSL